MFEKNYKKFYKNLELFTPFEKKAKIAVALSGGIDSMALAILTQRWLNESGNGSLIALTVNHNLQTTAHNDSAQVSRICYNLGIKHEILDWKHTQILSNIQSKARQARYSLLTEYCKQNDILHLFVASHLEDKVENFFIKLSRGSGLFGLAESNLMFFNNIRICKPLFNFTKSECKETLQSTNTPFVQDISNFQTKYFRNQIRFNFKNLLDNNYLSNELFQSRIATSINHLSHSTKLIQAESIRRFCDCITIHNQGYATVKANFINYPFDIQNYILSYLLTIISGSVTNPRSSSLNNIINLFKANALKTETLNKCIITKFNGGLIIYKEWHNISNSNVKIVDGLVWDGRFVFKLEHPLNNSDLMVCRLDQKSYKTISNKIDLSMVNLIFKNERKILFTIPVIKTLEKVVAIPTINYYDVCKENPYNQIRCFFSPVYFSKVMHLEY